MPLRVGSLLTCLAPGGTVGGAAPMVNKVPVGGGAGVGAPNGDVAGVVVLAPKLNTGAASGGRFTLPAAAGEAG